MKDSNSQKNPEKEKKNHTFWFLQSRNNQNSMILALKTDI